MKFSATFIILISITLGIHAVAAADQIVLPNTPMHNNQPASNVRPTLFDVLTIESGSSIFFSYARELELSRLFVDADANLTLLVPTNKAVMALARKPWVFSTEYTVLEMMLSHRDCMRVWESKVTKRRSQSMTPSNYPNKSLRNGQTRT
jgi:hypothetical protein